MQFIIDSNRPVVTISEDDLKKIISEKVQSVFGVSSPMVVDLEIGKKRLLLEIKK